MSIDNENKNKEELKDIKNQIAKEHSATRKAIALFNGNLVELIALLRENKKLERELGAA